MALNSVVPWGPKCGASAELPIFAGALKYFEDSQMHPSTSILLVF